MDAAGSAASTSYRQLLGVDGVVERCVLAGRFGFMAYHGGELEQRTEVIAWAAAEASGASLYTVEHPGPSPRHFPSTMVRREESAALDEFLEHVDVVVTVHGYGRWGRFTSLLLGGENRELAATLAEALRPTLPDYEVVTDLDDIPRELRGLHPANPVNVPRHGGVQLELPPRVRGLGPKWADWTSEEPVPPMAALIDALANVARTWPR
jgi:phage replication-related protein YjqB (UPF0714/DUF867 family)